MPSAIATPAPIISTPEDYFIPNPSLKKEIPVDALLCALSRARAVLSLIEDNGHNIRDGFIASHETLMNSLWCLSGILEQAETMIQIPFVKGASI